MAKKIFFITGIILAVLVILNFILYGAKGIDFLLFLGILFSVLLLFYPKYESIISFAMRNLLDFIFKIATVLTFIALLLVIIFLAINWPKEGPFDLKTAVPDIPNTEKESQQHLNDFIKKYHLQRNPSFRIVSKAFEENSYPNSKIQNAMSKIDSIQNMFFDYASNHVCSINTISFKSDHQVHLFEQHAFTSELYKISFLLSEENYEEANQRYIRLWRYIDKRFQSKKIVLDYFLNLLFVDLATQFYYDHQNELIFDDRSELIDLSNKIYTNFDQSFINGIKIKVIAFKNTKQLIKDDSDVLWIPQSTLGKVAYFILGEKRMWSWPLFDYFKMMRNVESFYMVSINYVDKPMYKIQKEFETYSELVDEIKTASFFENPSGNAVIREGTFRLDELIVSKEKRKSKLQVFNYVMKNLEQKEWEQPPIDNLCGEQYILSSEGDQLIITSKVKAFRVKVNPFPERE